MRTKHKFSSTNKTRPRKSAGARRRRQLEQKRRLIALGFDEAAANKMNPREILDKVRFPKKVTKELAAAAAKK